MTLRHLHFSRWFSKFDSTIFKGKQWWSNVSNILTQNFSLQTNMTTLIPLPVTSIYRVNQNFYCQLWYKGKVLTWTWTERKNFSWKLTDVTFDTHQRHKMDLKLVLVCVISLFVYWCDGRAFKQISNYSISSAVKRGYSCGSLCAGSYHICSLAAVDIMGKFNCLKENLRCDYNCQNDIGEIPIYESKDDTTNHIDTNQRWK